MNHRFPFLFFAIAFMVFAIPASAQEPILPGDLIKGSGPAVYYYHGSRYAFPNEDVYFSWYRDFSEVKTVSDEFLASVPLVANVRMHPGTYMIKITTDPKVYFIDNGNELRWIPTEAVAEAMYGSDWATKVRDVSDALFIDYRLGEPIPDETNDDLLPFAASLSYGTFSQALRRMNQAPSASFESFLRYPGLSQPAKLTANGYSASTTDPMEAVRSYYFSQAGGWELLYQDYLDTSFGSGHLLNFGRSRDGRFAHRSVAVSVASSTDYTVVEFFEADFPDGYLAYPRMTTAELHVDARTVFQHGLTLDPLSDIVAWYKTTAAARGWELVSESETGSLEDLGLLRRMYFRVPGTHAWLHVEVTQIGGIFRDLAGDFSSVVVEYIR